MGKIVHILMIEDSPDDALLILNVLKQNDYIVYHERVDTEEHLLNALSKNWDLILCDYSMPHLSAMNALRLVRKHDKEAPFIIVSGTIGEEKAVDIIKKGATDYINKLHLILLMPAIKRAFQEKKIKKENRVTKLALEETKKRFFHAFHQAGTGAALVNTNASFIEVNTALCSLLGYTTGELLKLKIHELIDNDSLKPPCH